MQSLVQQNTIVVYIAASVLITKEEVAFLLLQGFAESALNGKIAPMFKNWRFWLGAAVSAFFIYFALRGLDLVQVWHDVKTANYWWIIPGVFAYFLGVWIRTWRWHYLLRPIKAISVSVLWPIVVIGYMGNNIYPFRAG